MLGLIRRGNSDFATSAPGKILRGFVATFRFSSYLRPRLFNVCLTLHKQASTADGHVLRQKLLDTVSST